MIKFKTVILTSEKRQDDKINVKVRVTHNRIVRFVATDYYVLEKYFNVASGLILTGGGYTADEADKANGKIQMLIGDMVRKTDKLRNLRFMDMRSLMDILRDKQHPEQDLFAIMDKRIALYEKVGNINYAGTFKQTKSMLKRYTASRVIPFDSIDAGWLNKLDTWMRHNSMKKDGSGMRPNTIGVHMRNIRTIYNEAQKGHLVDRNAYPFDGYRIPKEKTRKRNLTAEEMRKIVHLKIKEPLMAWARDCYLLSFYLIGINMKDLAFLQEKNVEDDRIYYRRSKGKKDYSIKVYPEAHKIIDRYRGEKYLLNILDSYADYRTATKRINYKLKKVAELCKINKPITTYYARHSFATIASKDLGIPIDDIAYALGHSMGNDMTIIYVDFNQERIDEALRRVIDYITKPRQRLNSLSANNPLHTI